MTTQEQHDFYGTHYDMVGQWFVRPGVKVILGDTVNRACRFCGNRPPDVTFKKVAHAIPELLGNKSIECAYECDACNDLFGRGIENDLGNWSKPNRTLIRIRGKRGVPTLKKGGDSPGWRIEYDQNILNISSYEDDPIYEVDDEHKVITFRLRRDPYTPVAVLKAFMKIGLTLLPEHEVRNFQGLLTWVRETDHRKPYVHRCSVIYTFQPGPLPNDLIVAAILRRKPHVEGYPYAFLVLGYANEVFQVPLPSETQDRLGNGHTIKLHPFPVPGHPDTATYGVPGRAVLDWMDTEVKRGEIATVQMGYNSMTLVEGAAADSAEQSGEPQAPTP